MFFLQRNTIYRVLTSLFKTNGLFRQLEISCTTVKCFAVVKVKITSMNKDSK